MDETSKSTNQVPEGGQPPVQPGQSQQKNTGMAIVAYILFFVPLLTDAKNDPFVKFHVKQGLVLFLGWVVAMVLWATPLFIVAWLLDIGLVILLIIGIINAAGSKQKELPLVGKFAEHFKF